MALSLLNGLSAMGSATAAYAATTGLEMQKADLARQQTILADQLAGARQDKQNEFTGGQNTLNRQNVLDVTDKQTAASRYGADRSADATLGAARIHQLTATQVAQIQAGTMPAEVKEAQWLAAATPELKQAYAKAAMIKAGLPDWMMDSGGSAAATPSPAPGAPATSAPAAGAPAASSDVTGGAAPAPSDAPGASAAPTAPKPGALRNINDKALEGVPPAAQSIIKGMVEGRISPPRSSVMEQPYWRRMIELAATYDPSFDQSKWAARVAVTKDFFGGGKSAQAVTSMGTALGHAESLLKDFEKLNNTWSTDWNSLANNAANRTGDPRVTNARMGVDSLASEARKIFAASGSGGSLAELQEWQKNFPLNGSIDQQKASLSKFVDLLGSRIDALTFQGNRSTGWDLDWRDQLSPKARASYEKLVNGEFDSTGGTPPAARTDLRHRAKPAPASTPAPVAATPSAPTTFADPLGIR